MPLWRMRPGLAILWLMARHEQAISLDGQPLAVEVTQVLRRIHIGKGVGIELLGHVLGIDVIRQRASTTCIDGMHLLLFHGR